MASKGDDGGHVGSGDTTSTQGALWMVVSMSTCKEYCVPCFLFGCDISPLHKDLRATSPGLDDVTVVSLPGWLARGAFLCAMDVPRGDLRCSESNWEDPLWLAR